MNSMNSMKSRPFRVLKRKKLYVRLIDTLKLAGSPQVVRRLTPKSLSGIHTLKALSFNMKFSKAALTLEL